LGALLLVSGGDCNVLPTELWQTSSASVEVVLALIYVALSQFSLRAGSTVSSL